MRVLCSKLKLSGDFDFHTLARQTPGYVGADLAALTGAAGIIAVKRIFQDIADGKIQLPGTPPPAAVVQSDGNGMALDEGLRPSAGAAAPENGNPIEVDPPSGQATPAPGLSVGTLDTPLSSSIARFLLAHPSPLTPAQLEPLEITYADFLSALPTIQPSSKREGFATIPDVTWADIGALQGIRDELHMTIVQPILRPELFKSVGINAPSGVLLWGPPGCGKTLLAKAVANESRANFISVKGPELLNKVCVFTRPTSGH